MKKYKKILRNLSTENILLSGSQKPNFFTKLMKFCFLFFKDFPEIISYIVIFYPVLIFIKKLVEKTNNSWDLGFILVVRWAEREKLCLENAFEFFWNLKLSFEIWNLIYICKKNLCWKLLSLENPFESIWNLKLSFEIWKFNFNYYPVWKFISNMDPTELYHVHVFKFIKW